MEVRGVEGHAPAKANIFKAQGEVHSQILLADGAELIIRADWPDESEIAEHPELRDTGRIAVFERESSSVLEIMGSLAQLTFLVEQARDTLRPELEKRLRAIANTLAEEA
jgi:hypothetical protein